MTEFIIHIYGRVQGVGYRAFTFNTATRLGLKGHVRNLIDGGVEVAVQGEKDQLELFIDSLRQGPRLAVVDEVSFKERQVSELFYDFKVHP